MKHPTLHESEQSPPSGIDRSINQDDDADHDEGDPSPAPARRDTRTGADAWDKPGLVDTTRGPRA